MNWLCVVACTLWDLDADQWWRFFHFNSSRRTLWSELKGMILPFWVGTSYTSSHCPPASSSWRGNGSLAAKCQWSTGLEFSGKGSRWPLVSSNLAVCFWPMVSWPLTKLWHKKGYFFTPFTLVPIIKSQLPSSDIQSLDLVFSMTHPPLELTFWEGCY